MQPRAGGEHQAGPQSVGVSRGLFSLLARRGKVASWSPVRPVSSLAFSRLDFLGKVETAEPAVTDSGPDIVCHFSASSLKFLELGELIPAVIFFGEISRSFGLSVLLSSVDLASLEIVSPIELELKPLEYFFSRSDHLLSPPGFSSISLLMSSEMAESLLMMLLFLAKGAFSETMLLFLLDLLE